MSARAQSIGLLAGLALAFVPLAGWYFGLLRVNASDPNTLLPLLCFAGFSILALRQAKLNQAVFSDWRILIPIAGLWLLGIFQPVLPPIVQSVLFVCILTSALSILALNRWMLPGLLGLGLLSLPLIPNLQFFFGYPLRCLIAELATPLLWANGLPVQADGTSLALGDRLVVVDAPCSGIKMMWVCAFLVCAFGCIKRFGWIRMIAATAIALVLMLAANTLRAASLFLLESGLIEGQAWMHESVGLVVFAVFAGILALALSRLSHIPSKLPRTAQAPPRPHARLAWISLFLFSGGIGLTLAQAMIHTDSPLAEVHAALPDFPAQFEGRAMQHRPLTGDEHSVSEVFPGRIARFDDGKNEIIIKQVVRATRQLHMAEVCFKSWGYDIKHLPMAVDTEGHAWTTFTATKGDKTLRVRECVKGPNGEHWPDVSAWYWSALSLSNQGPWNAWIVAEKM